MIESINLNLIPSGVSPVCHVSQYDEGRQIKINLFEGINPYTIQSGDSFTLNVRKPDNTIVTTSVIGTQGNNYITISTTEQIAAVVGENLSELKITNGSTVIGTLNFIMIVERDVLADGIPSQSVIEDLDERIAEAIGDNYYNKTETDDLLALKADKTEFYNFYPTEQESGAIAHFTDGADNIPVKSLVSEIVAVQSGSGTPSPDNKREILGFDKGVITRCGKNIWNETTKNGYWNTTNGNYVSVAGQLCSNDYISVKENTAYYFYKGSTTNQSEVLFYDKSKTFIGYLNYSQCVNKAFTTPSNCAYITFNLGSNYGTTYLNNISFNYPSTDTSYHAYNGNNYTFAFGQTVYGGHLNVTAGDVESELDLVTYNGSENWQKNGEYFYIAVSSDNQVPFTVISNQYQGMPPTSYTIVPNGYMALSSGGYNYLNIHDNSYATLEDFKTALSNTNLQVLYKKATPTVIQLTPTEVPTLLGDNNFFSDTGDVDVTIRADIGLYIDKRLNVSRSTPNNLSRAAAYIDDPESVNESQEDNIEPQNEER